MPPPPDAPQDEPRDRREARLRPNAAEVAQVRALLNEIERRVFTTGAAARPAMTHKDIAGAVEGLFADG